MCFCSRIFVRLKGVYLLGWPKSSFRIFCTILGEAWMNFLANPIYLHTHTLSLSLFPYCTAHSKWSIKLVSPSLHNGTMWQQKLFLTPFCITKSLNLIRAQYVCDFCWFLISFLQKAAHWTFRASDHHKQGSQMSMIHGCLFANYTVLPCGMYSRLVLDKVIF